MKHETALHAYKRLVRENGEERVSILHGYEVMEPIELGEWPRKYVDHITEHDTSLFDGRECKSYIINVTW